METTFGNRISAIYTEIEERLWEHEVNTEVPINLSDDGFRAATKIFSNAALDALWKLVQKEQLPIDAAANMASEMGTKIRNLIKVYTGVDMWEAYDHYFEKENKLSEN